MLQVAYHTAFMGIYGYPTPKTLIWERHVLQRVITDTVCLALHGFDTWFWWYGLWTLKPTNGPEGNPVFFPYVGRVDIFQSWIKWFARVFNLWEMWWIALDLVTICAYVVQQRRMDRDMPPERLQEEAVRWLEEARIVDLNEYPKKVQRPGRAWSPTENTQDVKVAECQEAKIWDRSALRTNTLSGESDEDEKSLKKLSKTASPAELSKTGLGEKNEQSTTTTEVVSIMTASPLTDTWSFEEEPLPLQKPLRTNTSLLKRALMGWSSKTSHLHRHADEAKPRKSNQCSSHRRQISRLSNISLHRTPFNPTFHSLYVADQFLSAVAPAESVPHKHWVALAQYLLFPIRVLPRLLTTNFRPGLLLAVVSYRHHRSCMSNRLSYPEILRRTLAHPLYDTVNTDEVLLISRIQLVLTPSPPPSRRTVLVRAYATFAACAVLIISTELTIQWNYISGVQKIDAVGQFIPFSLGIGGLVKVVFGALFQREGLDEKCFGKCVGQERWGRWKEAAEGYKKARDCVEERRERRPLENVDREMERVVEKTFD
jgi:hypothetical protein